MHFGQKVFRTIFVLELLSKCHLNFADKNLFSNYVVMKYLGFLGLGRSCKLPSNYFRISDQISDEGKY
jgi:hypothetical protein